MTNAIEQSKREMYQSFTNMKGRIEINYSIKDMLRGADEFEGLMEDYLELLRQDHEALHETARKRFEDLQVAEAANQELQRKNDKQYEIIRSAENTAEEMTQRLAKMTEERDSIQLRLHAVDHAYNEQQSRPCTSGQDSTENVSCEAMDSKTAVILSTLSDAQRVMVEYLTSDGIRAKDAIGKMIPILDNEKLWIAMREFRNAGDGYSAWFLNNDKCQHSFHQCYGPRETCTYCGVAK